MNWQKYNLFYVLLEQAHFVIRQDNYEKNEKAGFNACDDFEYDFSDRMLQSECWNSNESRWFWRDVLWNYG